VGRVLAAVNVRKKRRKYAVSTIADIYNAKELRPDYGYVLAELLKVSINKTRLKKSLRK
jgi:hypothetical protein